MMKRHIKHMQHPDKLDIAQQIFPILTQHGALSYSVAKDILDYANELLERSAILPTPAGSTTENTLEEARGTVHMPYVGPNEFFEEIGMERLPDADWLIEVHLEADGTFALNVTAYHVLYYATSIKVPFSDFSENVTCLDDLKRLIIDAVHRQTVKRGVPRVS
jgi:hypothetical protein